MANGEITLMKKQKQEVIKCINVLNKNDEKMYNEAEVKQNFDLLTKANFLRKAVWDKEKIQ